MFLEGSIFDSRWKHLPYRLYFKSRRILVKSWRILMKSRRVLKISWA